MVSRLAIAAGLLLLAGLTLFRLPLTEVTLAVLHRDGSSHGLFVPFISAFYIWDKREELMRIPFRFDYFGLPLLGAGVMPYFLKTGIFHVEFLGFIAFLAGAVILISGRSFFKAVYFPIIFLTAMSPIPPDIYNYLANSIRHLSFAGSRLMISLLGISFYHEGWKIQLHNADMLVALSCSGIRYLLSFMVFGTAYAFLFKTTFRSRLGTILMTVPISIAASIFRLTAIFVLTYLFGPKMAEPQPHILISWAVFLSMAFTIVWIDQRFCKRIGKKTANSQ
ncbi:MAG: exosortase/archaeosortase family protein [Desulfobacterales bacterium]|nr:exosortase/archaeosortase family protein [Desulfobacterales bacterium]